MIFDCETVTTLVLEWQREKHPATLESIIEKSRSLVEAIVSSYDPEFREDLIQESFLKVQYALPFYNPLYSLHTYLTTVIHNCCKTFIKKQYRDLELYDEDFEFLEYCGYDERPFKMDDTLVEDVLVRNRKRFPSLPVATIDEASEVIVVSLKDGLYGKSRGIIAMLCKQCGFPKSIASTVYYSTLIYLRERYISNAKDEETDDEFTLLRDMKDVVGDMMYVRVSLLFSGIPLRIP